MTFNRRALLGASLAAGALALPRQASAITADALFPMVDTAQGKLRGMTAAGVSMFKGIRYGGDTSGRNRFMPPTPPPKWAGVRNAYDPGRQRQAAGAAPRTAATSGPACTMCAAG